MVTGVQTCALPILPLHSAATAQATDNHADHQKNQRPVEDAGRKIPDADFGEGGMVHAAYFYLILQ